MGKLCSFPWYAILSVFLPREMVLSIIFTDYTTKVLRTVAAFAISIPSSSPHYLFCHFSIAEWYISIWFHLSLSLSLSSIILIYNFHSFKFWRLNFFIQFCRSCTRGWLQLKGVAHSTLTIFTLTAGNRTTPFINSLVFLYRITLKLEISCKFQPLNHLISFMLLSLSTKLDAFNELRL